MSSEDLPQPPKELPRRRDAFRHWKGAIYVVTGVSRSEANPSEFNVQYLPEGVSDDDVIPWSRPFSNFWQLLEPNKDGCSVLRFGPVGQREIPTYTRPELLAFVRAMEDKLRKNEHKGGWKDESPFDLLDRVVDEIDELDKAIQNHPWTSDGEHKDSPEAREASRNVLSEAADVANFCMFVADVCGSLGREREPQKVGR